MTGVCTATDCGQSISDNAGFPYCETHREEFHERTKRQERPKRWVGNDA